MSFSILSSRFRNSNYAIRQIWRFHHILGPAIITFASHSATPLSHPPTAFRSLEGAGFFQSHLQGKACGSSIPITRVAWSYGAAKEGSTGPALLILQISTCTWKIPTLTGTWLKDWKADIEWKSAASTPSSGHSRATVSRPAEKLQRRSRFSPFCCRALQRWCQARSAYMAEKDLSPCGNRDESKFSPDLEVPLIGLGVGAISSQQAQYFLRLSE